MPGSRLLGDAPILVAVDFSPGSEIAFAWGVKAALDLGAPLIVLHVVHDPADAPGYYTPPKPEQLGPLEDAASAMMAGYVERVGSQLPELRELEHFETAIVVGLPVTRILEVAEKEGARLIVMGGQGRTGLSDRLLGSKVERVARLSHIPVTIVKRAEGSE